MKIAVSRQRWQLRPTRQSLVVCAPWPSLRLMKTALKWATAKPPRPLKDKECDTDGYLTEMSHALPVKRQSVSCLPKWERKKEGAIEFFELSEANRAKLNAPAGTELLLQLLSLVLRLKCLNRLFNPLLKNIAFVANSCINFAYQEFVI